MPKTEITYKPVDVDEKATHGDYKHLCQRWEGLTPGTAKVWQVKCENIQTSSNSSITQLIRLYLSITKDFACLSNGKVVIALVRRKKRSQKCLRISRKKKC